MMKCNALKPPPSRRAGVARAVRPANQYDHEVHDMIKHVMKISRGRAKLCRMIGIAMEANPGQTAKSLQIFADRQEHAYGFTYGMTEEQTESVTDEIHACAAAMALSEQVAKSASQQLRENQIATMQGIFDNPVDPIKARGMGSLPPASMDLFDYATEVAHLGEVYNQGQAGLGEEWVKIPHANTTKQAAAEQNMTGPSEDDEIWDDLDDVEMNPAPPTPCNTSEEAYDAEDDDVEAEIID